MEGNKDSQPVSKISVKQELVVDKPNVKGRDPVAGENVERVLKEHPVIKLLQSHEQDVKGLIDRIHLDPGERERALQEGNDNLFTASAPERMKAIRQSPEFLRIAKEIFAGGRFALGTEEIIAIGTYLNRTLPRPDVGYGEGGVGPHTQFRSALVNVIGAAYCMAGIGGVTAEMFDAYVTTDRFPQEITGNREVLTEMQNRSQAAREVVKKRSPVKYGTIDKSIFDDFGNGFSPVDLRISLALRRLPPAPSSTS